MTALSFNEVLERDAPELYARIDKRRWRWRTPIAKAAAPTIPLRRIETPRSSSSIAVEISAKVQGMRKPGETISDAWARAGHDPEVNRLYAEHRAAQDREAGRFSGPSTPEAAANTRAGIEAEIDALARRVMAENPGLTFAQSYARALEIDAGLYARYRAAHGLASQPVAKGEAEALAALDDVKRARAEVAEIEEKIKAIARKLRSADPSLTMEMAIATAWQHSHEDYKRWCQANERTKAG